MFIINYFSIQHMSVNLHLTYISVSEVTVTLNDKLVKDLFLEGYLTNIFFLLEYFSQPLLNTYYEI